MILLKLLLAHFIGDFLLQPKSWVKDKENRKIKSPKLYFHFAIHGLLVLLVLMDIQFWPLALAWVFAHGIIDILKLYVQKDASKSRWFLIDQLLHILSIVLLWIVFFRPEINLSSWLNNDKLWIYAIALFFLTRVSGIVIEVLMSKWSKSLDQNEEASLDNAGRYIGILERLFVFTFVLTGNWAAIGFLIAAKSVFRFGGLRESKSRKLTEYILIGTLLSFAIAIATSLAVLALIQMV
ncbi:MAG: DUF3307 domain-containing protein [Bacteroidales bacterium]|nr:DUF3307 domain-containing protein [Bacteroidales bacterium]